MTRDAVVLFLALLALSAQVMILGGIVAVGLRRSVVVSAVGPLALAGAAAIAVTSTLGSLYLSEVAHFTPCRLCWYQRIAMYPLSVLLVVAAARRDGAVRRYATPLAIIGALIASYHVLLERFPNLETSACDPNNPCSLIWVKKFGYLTIPTMALTGFIGILALLLVHHWSEMSEMRVGHRSLSTEVSRA